MFLIIAFKTLILFKIYIQCNAIKMLNKHLINFVVNEARKLAVFILKSYLRCISAYIFYIGII